MPICYSQICFLIYRKTERYQMGGFAMCMANARFGLLRKISPVVSNKPSFRSILSTFKKLLTPTSAISFVGQMRTATGGPLSQVRVSVSCSKTAPYQEHQTELHVPNASVARGCELIYLALKWIWVNEARFIRAQNCPGQGWPVTINLPAYF